MSAVAERRVAVTGVGILCALGTTREESWRSLTEGRCGIREATLFDTTGYRSRLVGQLPDYEAERHFTTLERRRLSRSDQIATLAATEALADSGLLAGGSDTDRVAVVLGSGTSDLLRNEEFFAESMDRGVGRAWPSKVFNHFTNTPADAIAARFRLGGPRMCLLSACSSGTMAIGHAADLVRFGQADAALAGGSDVLCRLTLSGFNALRLVSLAPCRPFDRDRSGLNLGEAAAILVLEEMSAARRRGAPVYAELAGYGAACEAHHATQPEPDGRTIARVLRAALAAAGLDVEAVDHINAHGTATPQNDRAEARGLKAVFGARAARIPVTSIKSMIGHCLSAAGAIEAAALALTISRGVIPPTIHYETRDPECDLDVVANVARGAQVDCGVSLSLAFGGNDAALVMTRV